MTPLRLRLQPEHVKVSSQGSDELEEDDPRLSLGCIPPDRFRSGHVGHQQSLGSILAGTPSVPQPSPPASFKKHADVFTVGTVPSSLRLSVGLGSTSRIISSRLTNEWPYTPTSGSAIRTLPNARSDTPVPAPPPPVSTAQSFLMPQRSARDDAQVARHSLLKASLLNTPNLNTAPTIGYQLRHQLSTNPLASSSHQHHSEKQSASHHFHAQADPRHNKSLAVSQPFSSYRVCNQDAAGPSPSSYGGRSNFARLQVSGAVRVRQ